MDLEVSLFDEVADALRGMCPPELAPLRCRVRRYSVKVWFGSAAPSREHYEAQVIGARDAPGATTLALEIGFHAEHPQRADNDAVIAHLLANEARWRRGVGAAAEAGPFLGRAGTWRRVSETWRDPDLEAPELPLDIATRLLDYLTALEPLRRSRPAPRGGVKIRSEDR